MVTTIVCSYKQYKVYKEIYIYISFVRCHIALPIVSLFLGPFSNEAFFTRVPIGCFKPVPAFCRGVFGTIICTVNNKIQLCLNVTAGSVRVVWESFGITVEYIKLYISTVRGFALWKDERT